MYYTPAQVSEMLKIPPSTLRFYAKKFAACLSDQGRRKKRLYTESDLVTFSRIKDLLALNVPLDQIATRILTESPAPAPTQPTESALALVPSIAAELEYANSKSRDALARAEDLQRRTDQIQNQLDQLRKWAALPWWKRLFTHPPTRD